ncbi:PQQ-dependent sugar dehydrogenase [Litchfieldella xinjiangensis]|uniref:PQQ-dependent sugar dehydrogenase n=1 Tax=Litchfieldella xinjiangensis TaxID=1166948 RepID=UPI0005BE560F|nr:PQQ-dependent sugar dehydrogenase [Halomonas xinjiangensis]
MRRLIVAAITLMAGLAEVSAATTYHIATVAEGLDHPWSLAFLPNDDMLVTERAGRLRLIRAGEGLQAAPVEGAPEVYAEGQAGLFEVLLAPDHEESGVLFLSYACGEAKANTTCLDRARFDGERLMDRETLFRALPDTYGASHYGGRMLLLPDDTLLLGLGDGFDYREHAQNPANHLGSVVRLTTDGDVPEDNPFLGVERAQPELFSVGHRNVQGLAYDAERREILLHEHGPRGGDELNRIQAGGNYGWPMVTHGVDYTGARISPYTDLGLFESPLLHWTPSIAPSGMTLYDASLFPEWQGDLFVATLAARHVVRLNRVDGRIVAQEPLFAELGERIRDIRTSPDGALYLLTDSDEGRVLRVMPTEQR